MATSVLAKSTNAEMAAEDQDSNTATPPLPKMSTDPVCPHCLAFHPVTKSACSACHKDLYGGCDPESVAGQVALHCTQIVFHPSGAPLCEGCALVCERCGEVLCPKCAEVPCEDCEEFMCFACWGNGQTEPNVNKCQVCADLRERKAKQQKTEGGDDAAVPPVLPK